MSNLNRVSSMDIEIFNALGPSETADFMRRRCAASRWVGRVVDGRPYPGVMELLAKAEERWSGMMEADWLEAFDGRPRRGRVEHIIMSPCSSVRGATPRTAEAD